MHGGCQMCRGNRFGMTQPCKKCQNLSASEWQQAIRTSVRKDGVLPLWSRRINTSRRKGDGIGLQVIEDNGGSKKEGVLKTCNRHVFVGVTLPRLLERYLKEILTSRRSCNVTQVKLGILNSKDDRRVDKGLPRTTHCS